MTAEGKPRRSFHIMPKAALMHPNSVSHQTGKEARHALARERAWDNSTRKPDHQPLPSHAPVDRLSMDSPHAPA